MALRISIVTPNLNTGRYLAATMDSVLAADDGNLDYIVVDGGSSDGSQDVIKAREKRLARWLSEKDDGLYNALNKGFALASGEVMAWLNSGDLYFRDSFALVGEIFARFPEVDWLTSRVVTILDEKGRIVFQTLNSGFERTSFLRGEHLTGLRRGLSLVTIQQESTFWRRSLWERAGGRLDDSYALAGDFDLWVRFFRHSQPCAISAPLGAFRQHPDQLSERHREAYLREATQVLERAGQAPKASVLSNVRVMARMLTPRPLRPWAHRLSLFAPALVCQYELDRRDWRLSKF